MTIFGWHRPYINWAPWDLAEYLVKNGRPANECWDLIWFEIMSPTADEALQNAQTFVESRLQNNPQLTNIILVGYSWGGGMVHKFSQWIAKNHGNITITGSAYVDAVTQGNLACGFPEPFIPVNTCTMLNIYQSNVGIASDGTLNGMAMNNNGSIPMIQIDCDGIQDSQTHSTIDNYAAPFVLRYISSLISYGS